MKNIKDTTINCRCFKPAKEHTQRTLEKENLILSKVYEVLKNNNGLCSKYDNETARMLRDVVRETRNINIPFQTDNNEISKIKILKEEIIEKAEKSINKLYTGVPPIYLYNKYECTADELNTIYYYYEITNQNLYQETINRIKQIIKKRRKSNNKEKINKLKVPLEERYTIRETYEKKGEKDISERIRSLLDWIDEIPSQSKEKERTYINYIYDKINKINIKRKQIQELIENKSIKRIPKVTITNYIEQTYTTLLKALKYLPDYRWTNIYTTEQLNLIEEFNKLKEKMSKAHLEPAYITYINNLAFIPRQDIIYNGKKGKINILKNTQILEDLKENAKIPNYNTENLIFAESKNLEINEDPIKLIGPADEIKFYTSNNNQK